MKIEENNNMKGVKMGRLKKRVAIMIVITMFSMDFMVKATSIGGIAYEQGLKLNNANWANEKGKSYQSELIYPSNFNKTTVPGMEVTTAPGIQVKVSDLNYVLFTEDFTGSDAPFTSNDTWDVQVHTDKGGQIDRRNESLHLSVAGNNVVYSKEEVARPTKDVMLNSETYSVEANMTLGEKHVKGSYFIGFAVNPVTKEGYELEYHQSGLLRIIKNNSSGQHNGKEVNYSLDKGKTYNIRVVVYPTKIEVFIDGSLVLEEENSQAFSIGRGISLRAQFAEQDVTFDDIKVRVDKANSVYNVSSQASTDGEVGDISGGTLVLEKYISTGKEVVLNPLVKNNYMLDSNEPFTFFNDEKGEKVDIEVVNGKFVMPSYPLTVTANFVSKPIVEEVVYYVDSINGDDSNTGTSQDAPLKTIDRLNRLELNPGDRLLFKAGSTFNAVGGYRQGKYLFTPKGSGKEGKPIIIGVYGEGEKPRLNGCGVVETVIYLNNQEHIIIEGLEITNEDSSLPHTYELNQNTNTTKVLRGIHINAKDYGVVRNITLRDLYIHNINGKLNYKWNGGIFANADGTIVTNQSGKRELIGIPTKYDGILIENNTFEKVDRSGIKLISSQWCNKSVTNDPTVPINWYPSTNVIVRGNYMDDIGGDGITVRDTDGALIEYNLVRESNKQEKITGYNVAIWPFQADNTVVQFNEAYLTYGLKDGQGFDADHLSNNSVIQYNYSHDNVGGFVLVMGWYQMYENINGSPIPTNETNPGVTIRYNISQNDLDHTFEITRGIPSGMSIYNNTIYLAKKLNVSVFDLAGYPNSESNLYEDFYVFNNVFYYDGEASGAKFYGQGDKAIEHLKKYGHFTHNAYYGITPPEEDKNPIVIQDGNLEFVDLGRGPGTDTGLRIPIAGKNLGNQLDGYKLKTDSVLIDAGLTIDDIYNEAQYKDKILGTQKNPFKAINGVDYTKDFFGNEFISNQSKPDIGACEVQIYETGE